MIGNQKNKDEGFVVVATKVPPYISDLLSILAKMRGMEVYDLLQLLIHGFISYAKADMNVPDEFRHLYESLKFDVAWNNAYNFASRSAQNDIAQMVLVLQQPGRSGFGMTMITKPFMDDAKMTTSVTAIVERILELALGTKDYKRLRFINEDLNTFDPIGTIRAMIAAQEIVKIEESDAQEMPGVGNYHDFGKAIAYGQRTRQTKTRTPDTMVSRQQRIIFDEDDATTTDAPESYGEKADKYLRDLEERAKEEELGFRPFDQEY